MHKQGMSPLILCRDPYSAEDRTAFSKWFVLSDFLSISNLIVG